MDKHPGGKVRQLFWQAATAESQEQFANILKSIEQIQMDISDYIRRIPAKNWAQFAIETPQFEYLILNIIKYVKSSWTDICHTLILEAIHLIWISLIKKFHI